MLSPRSCTSQFSPCRNSPPGRAKGRQAPAARRFARIRLDRAGRRCGVVRVPRGILCRAQTAPREYRRAQAVDSRDGDGDRQGGGHYRQAATRSYGNSTTAIHAGVHQIQQSRKRGTPAGAAGLSAEPRPSDTAVLCIDLDALVANYRRLCELASPAECAAVVKADAYGLGMAQAAPVLAHTGCKTFFVATLGEGEGLRRLLPDATIYVFSGLMPGTGGQY